MALAISPHSDVTQLRLHLFEIGLHIDSERVSTALTAADMELKQVLIHQLIAQNLAPPRHALTSVDLLTQLELRLKDKQPDSRFLPWRQFHDELARRIECLALRNIYQTHWQQRLQLATKVTFIDFIQQKLPAHKQLHVLEQWAANSATQFSQPLITRQKPCYPRMSLRDHLRFNPEFQARVSLRFLAIAKHHLPAESVNIKHVFNQHFPRELALWQEHLYHLGLNDADYWPFVVHPAVWRHDILPHNQAAINAKVIIPLTLKQTAYPLADGHTFLTKKPRAPLVQLTSPSPHQPLLTVASSQALNQLTSDNYAFARCISSQHLTNISPQPLHFALLNNPCEPLLTGESQLPFTALFTAPPQSSAPLIVDLINNSQRCCLDYLTQLTSLTLGLPLRLFFERNIVMDGSLTRSWIKKSSQGLTHLVRFDTPAFFYQGSQPQCLHLVSATPCDNQDALTNRLYQQLLLPCINPLLSLWQTHYQGEKATLLDALHQRLIQQLDLLPVQQNQLAQISLFQLLNEGKRGQSHADFRHSSFMVLNNSFRLFCSRLAASLSDIS